MTNNGPASDNGQQLWVAATEDFMDAVSTACGLNISNCRVIPDRAPGLLIFQERVNRDATGRGTWRKRTFEIKEIGT
jgi:hypothetical protein